MRVKSPAKVEMTSLSRFFKSRFDAVIKFLKICCAALCAATAMSSQASFLSDVWWVPEESGWGASVTQQGDNSFVTLFVFGPTGEPIWYVANTRSVFPTEPPGLPSTGGPLYRMHGSWFGGLFDPKSVQATLVGSLSVEPINSKDAIFRYNVDGVRVTKTATRFTVGTLNSDFSAPVSYRGSMHLYSYALPTETVSTFTLRVENGRASLTTQNDTSECTYSGPIAQFGKFTSIKGTFQCKSGSLGEVDISEMEVNRNGFTARISFTPTMFGDVAPYSLKGTIAGARQ
jgi:hypothetical protein